MIVDAVFSPREVAEISGAPKRAIEKAIEEGVLRVRVARGRVTGPARRRVPATQLLTRGFSRTSN